jgi:glyoxylase-like metal-dependent hydrolase (beta-lactamase superfamily II)
MRPVADRVAPGAYGVRFARGAAARSNVYLRFAEYREVDAQLQCDFWFWIIVTGDTATLFDTGFDRIYGDRLNLNIDLPMVEALSILGLAPADVGEIVLSHLHSDHTGNLELFPEAMISLQRDEWSFWFGPYGRRGLFANEMLDEYLAHVAAAAGEGRVRLLGGPATIAPGLRTAPMPGHTPGSQVLIIDSAAGRLLLAADVAHFHEELHADRPFIIAADVAAMYASFDLLRSYEAEGVRVIPGHEAAVAEDFPVIFAGPGVARVVRLCDLP